MDFKGDICWKCSLSILSALVAPGIFIDHWNLYATVSNLFSGKKKNLKLILDSGITKMCKIRIKKRTDSGKS